MDLTAMFLSIALLFCIVFLARLSSTLSDTRNRMGVLALHIKELDDTLEQQEKRWEKLALDVNNMDAATGKDIYALRHDLDQFKQDFGDAAIEEMREAAKSEKAWRDGVQNIMTFGNQFQGRGDKT